ncbi:MAG: hypothetical protein ACREJ0_14360 [Geminicoccaceae bacterium]
MTAGMAGLVASYVVLAMLLLSLNLRSAWGWPVKAAAIGITAGFFVVAFVALQAMLGWPTEAPPPARFQLHAALIEEPDRKARSLGAIYLWLSPRHADGALAGPPRAYALPYSRALHEATVRAQAGLAAGRPIDGRSGRSSWPSGLAMPSVPIELFERPPPRLFPKTG